MKYGILLLLFSGLISCESKVAYEDQDYAIAEATLANNLAVDGCSWHFSITKGSEFTQYTNDASSQNLVDKIILKANNQSGVWSIKVKITYRLTDAKKDVQCGWNTVTKMEEISIKEISIL